MTIAIVTLRALINFTGERSMRAFSHMTLGCIYLSATMLKILIRLRAWGYLKAKVEKEKWGKKSREMDGKGLGM